MQMQVLRLRGFIVLAGLAISALSGWASADPPSRIARLGYMAGAVSFSPAGESDWVHATINRPLTTGDRLWADSDERAEIQVGGALIRMNGGSGLAILNLDDRITQLQLTQGIFNIRVRRLEPNQVFEVDTPNLAFTLRQAGEYRIEVEAEGNGTTIIVRKGRGEVYGEGAAYVIDTRQAYRFTGTGLRDYQYVAAPRSDEFDRWASARDRSYDNSSSARYVSQDVVGYQDLDANGTWRVDPDYGNVWMPNRVATGWAPYHEGHWAWVDPWGWTWVDDAPWGFAVSHYGRWAHFDGRWGWVPGPVRSRAYYAPALVVFMGGNNFQLGMASGNVGGVGWFPLAPREVYRPSYAVSRGYYENINRSNTVINNTVINNTYNTTNVTNVIYANQQVPGAVVAVPTSVFVQSQPVSKAAVRVSREMMVNAPIAVVPPLAPTESSVRGAAPQGSKPPPRMFERAVVASIAPPAAAVGFAKQRQQLTATPGKPLDDAARSELKPASVAPLAGVKVVARPQEPSRILAPPPPVLDAQPSDARKKSDERKVPVAPANSDVPGKSGVATQSGAPSQATPPLPAVPAPEQRGNREQRREQRGQPEAPPPPTPQRALPAPVATPQVAPLAPRTLPLEQSGPGGRDQQRGRSLASPPQSSTPPRPVSVPVPATPSPVVTPVPTAQPPEQRLRAEQRSKEEQRGQLQILSPQPPPLTPPPRPAQTKPVPLQVAPAAASAQPSSQAPPQGSTLPRVPPSRVAAPVPQHSERRLQPEPAPSAKQASPRPPVIAPLPPPRVVPQEGSRGPEHEPGVSKPTDKKKDSDEQKREEENRKQVR